MPIDNDELREDIAKQQEFEDKYIEKPVIQRDDRGRFLPDVNNPNPKGKRISKAEKSRKIAEKLELMLLQEFDEEIGLVLRKAFRMAKGGDRVLMKFLLERVLPIAQRNQEEKQMPSGGVNIIIEGFEPKNIRGEVIENNTPEKPEGE